MAKSAKTTEADSNANAESGGAGGTSVGVPPGKNHTVTLFRGTPIEAMNEADLRASLRVTLKALNDIAGAQSERQVARIIEGLGL